MTKEELKTRVDKWKEIRECADNHIYSAVMNYIRSLPYKVGDIVNVSHRGHYWIECIKPEYSAESGFTGDIKIGVTLSKNITSNIIWLYGFETINKID